jgi:hypothetical protein
MKLKYCDGIAAICRGAIRQWIDSQSDDNAIKSVGNVKYDLHKDGYLLSTKKTISVEDIYGQKYKITIEEDDSEAERYPAREDIPAELWGKKIEIN